MSSSARSKSVLPVPHEVLLAVSADVELDGVSLELVQFALKLAYIHYLLFDLPLKVTAGRCISRCQGVSHENGRALDVQTNDLTPAECEVFLAITDYLANHAGMIRGAAPLGDDYASMHLERKQQ